MSALAEAEPTSVSDILEKAPQDWTQENLTALVNFFRNSRAKFAAADAEAKINGKKKKEPKAKLEPGTEASLLDDLNF